MHIIEGRPCCRKSKRQLGVVSRKIQRTVKAIAAHQRNLKNKSRYCRLIVDATQLSLHELLYHRLACCLKNAPLRPYVTTTRRCCTSFSRTPAARRSVPAWTPWSSPLPNPDEPGCCPKVASWTTRSVVVPRKSLRPWRRKTRRTRALWICCTQRPSLQHLLRVRGHTRTHKTQLCCAWHAEFTTTHLHCHVSQPRCWLNTARVFSSQMHTGHLRVPSTSYLPTLITIPRINCFWAQLLPVCNNS